MSRSPKDFILLAAGFNPLRLKEIKKTEKFKPIIRISKSGRKLGGRKF
jgi:hypothetical protein